MRPGPSLLLAAGLAACSFQPGAFSTEDGDGGMTDDAGSGSGSGSGSGDVDTDGDAVADASDNCVSVANTDQRNHDSDARGDACDACPHLPSASDPDGDGDGIGDACDPRPTLTGDTVALWEGFYDDAGFATWTSVGTWSVDSGVLSQTDETAPTAYAFPDGVTVARAAMTVGVTMLEIGTPTGEIDPAINIYTGTQGTTQGYACRIVADTTNDLRAFAYWPGNGATTDTDSDSIVWLGTFMQGSQLRMTDTIIGNAHNCTVAQGPTVTQSLATLHGPTSGIVLLITERTAASFDYVFVVAVGT